jgi:hypothetical protein
MKLGPVPPLGCTIEAFNGFELIARGRDGSEGRQGGLRLPTIVAHPAVRDSRPLRDFPVGQARNAKLALQPCRRPAGWKARETADKNVCATLSPDANQVQAYDCAAGGPPARRREARPGRQKRPCPKNAFDERHSPAVHPDEVGDAGRKRTVGAVRSAA